MGLFLKSYPVSLQGTVVHRRAYGENHGWVEMITHEQGRIRLLARGARVSQKRFGGALDLFVSVDFQAQYKRDLWTLVTADIKNARWHIRQSLEALTRAGHLCACARALAPEMQGVSGLLHALEEGLDLLNQQTRQASIQAAAMYPRMVKAAGILPQGQICCLCQQMCSQLGCTRPGTGPGLVCKHCDPRAAMLTSGVLAALQGAPVENEATAQAVEACVMGWVSDHVGRALSTWMPPLR